MLTRALTENRRTVLKRTAGTGRQVTVDVLPLKRQSNPLPDEPRRLGRRLALAAGAVALAAAGAWTQQAAPMPGLDAATQGPAILAHLGSVIQYYRSVQQPLQRAGNPNDVVYREQGIAEAAQIAGFAFQSARAESALITGSQPASQATGEQQRLQATEETIGQRIAELREREAALDRQAATASPQQAGRLASERNQVQAALDLALAMQEALQRITTISGTANSTGLAADVTRLQESVPELTGNNKTSAPQLTTVESALSSGVTTQASVLLQLVETLHGLASLAQENDHLQRQVTHLRAPMLTILRGLLQEGQQLSQQAEASLPVKHAAAHAGAKAAGGPAAPAPEDLQAITARFKALSAATVPLSQELIVLEQSQANLTAWQTSVRAEYGRILHSLLLRLVVIALALGVIIGSGELWTRATNKYVRDLRRRRQLLIVRRVAVGFLSVLVVLFGFVTQFTSLATFAGFLTAGIAVGLQTILLSVAAYFFIIGRYGIKVGDRITIASVTGDVIDVGLVRFYLMELAGTGTMLNPTGRVAVFSNAVLFQATTPLFKQMPGTGYAWHELTVQLADAADYRTVCPAIMAVVQGVYEGYRAEIEQQHTTVQNWMQASIEAPGVESRLQFTAGAFQLWARFPVEIRQAAETDEKITHALLELMATNPAIKAAVTARPSIQPSVRG